VNPGVVIEVRNTRTEIHFAPPELIRLIDIQTSYKTQALEDLAKRVAEFNSIDPAHAWDGTYHFLHQPKTKAPWLPTGLRDLVVQCCERMGYPFRIQDLRQAPEEDVPRYYKPIPLWEHQEEAVQAVLKSPDGVVVMPPRAGKTRTFLEVFRKINQPTLWIAPTTAIVSQTVDRALEWFSEQDVQQISTNPTPVQRNALLTITTAAAAKDLPAEFMSTRQCLIGDELHHFLANNKWGSQLLQKTEHIYYRYGMTGTFFRSAGDDMAMHAFLSRRLYEITTRELMAKNFLVPTYVAFIEVNAKRLRRAAGVPTFHGEGGIGYHGLHTHDYRNDLVADVAAILHEFGKTVLVLVGAKAQGEALASRIRDRIKAAPSGAEFHSVEFVSTSRPRPIQKRIIASFTAGQEVKVLIGTSLVGEGVDLPNADALVYARGEMAAVTLVQGWFRVCTASPGKTVGIVVDFVDSHQTRLLEHSRQRWRVASQEPLFRLSHLTDVNDFARWVGRAAL